MIPSLLGNHTELAMNCYGIFRQHILNGDVIPLMTVGEQRNPHFPDVPTVNELGMVNANAARAYFFAFPKGTDDAILHRLSDAAYVVQQNPEFIREIQDMFSIEPFFVPTAEAQAFLDDMWAESEKFKEHLVQ
jgi:tripartite-type tricarboxylate transporter receptor subunit TctC